MVSGTCERLWEVDALREKRLGQADVASFERHRATCAVCDARWREDERLRTLGRALPVPRVDALDARRQRAALLKDAATPRASFGRARVVVGAALLAAVAVAAIVASTRVAPLHAVAGLVAAVPSPAPSTLAGAVRGSEGAVWSQRRDGDVETVALETGTLVVEVRHQRDGEHFLVALPDGEIEVRGTVFEVTAGGGRTLSVDVREGVVALRLRGNDERILRAGESWPPVTAVAIPSSVVVPPRASASTPPRTAGSSDARGEYDEAMRVYRSRRYDEAARAFRAFVLAHPTAPESEDAAFLEAASLAFAGRTDAAAIVAERFLEHHPRSFHARDAAILVARAARDRGDCERARRALAPWIASDAADVRSALGACTP